MNCVALVGHLNKMGHSRNDASCVAAKEYKSVASSSGLYVCGKQKKQIIDFFWSGMDHKNAEDVRENIFM